jgi:hypothetical protein
MVLPTHGIVSKLAFQPVRRNPAGDTQPRCQALRQRFEVAPVDSPHGNQRDDSHDAGKPFRKPYFLILL